MLKHYLLVAIRNLSRQKTFSFINITGLALGMACCLFIYMWVSDERSIDNFHANGDNLYNVFETVNTNNVITGTYNSSIRADTVVNLQIHMADVVHEVQEIESVNFYATGYELPWGYPETFQIGDKKFKFEGARASEDFFTTFSYPVIAGAKDKALKDLSSIAISRKMASQFFDSPDHAIGQSIRFENKFDFIITSVFEDVAANSSLRFDFLINWTTQMTRMSWASPNFLTTLKIKPGSDIKLVEEKINRYMAARLDKNDPRKITVGLQPFGDRHLFGTFVNGKPVAGRIYYVRIFSGIAVFILVIACINFMNLATARSIRRAKEIGVRKVVGSGKARLILQFLGESLVLSVCGMIIALAVTQLLLPAFNQFTGKHISSPFSLPLAFIVIPSLALVTGLLAGSYPAMFLSSLKPVRVLKGIYRFSTQSVFFRRGLSVFQFSISIILLIVTIVMTQQTSFVQKTNIGYDRSNLIYMNIEGEMMDYANTEKNYRTYQAFKDAALKMPGVAMIDRASEMPHTMTFVVDENDAHVETASGDDAINWEGKQTSVGFKPMSVGFDFLNILNLQVVEGRGFSHDIASDSSDAFMINEEAVRQMGIKDPVGKWISAWNKKGHIIGVLKDYNNSSLHDPIRPLIMDVKEYEYFGVMIVKTEAGKTNEALASLEKVYHDVNPNYPFAYKIVDDEYNKLYKNEQVVTALSNVFAGVAILISCLGLLGLVMFSAQQRTKEFGIRKVLGASVGTIVGLLSRDFIKLVFIAFLVAAPLGWYLMNEWLNTFAYKISLSWWIFALSGAVALMIAFLTVAVQALQSAVENPVKSLRSE